MLKPTRKGVPKRKKNLRKEKKKEKDTLFRRHLRLTKTVKIFKEKKSERREV